MTSSWVHVVVILWHWRQIPFYPTVNNLAADDLATQRTMALFQYTISRLIVRSRKVSKARDRVSKCLYRFEIWQVRRQQCCRGVCQISKRSGNSRYKSRGYETLRELTIRRIMILKQDHRRQKDWYWCSLSTKRVKGLPIIFIHKDGLVQDCSNCIANSLELLQSCTEPSNCLSKYCVWFVAVDEVLTSYKKMYCTDICIVTAVYIHVSNDHLHERLLIHRDRYKMAAILEETFSNVFSWMNFNFNFTNHFSWGSN